MAGIMDATWCVRVVPVALLLLFVIAGSGVESIRCNFCIKLNNNEDCNANIAECTNTKHDACYTTVLWLNSTTKHYTKGCHSYDDCHKLETPDRAKCDKEVMNCTYCCRDRSMCNAFNSANPQLATLPLSWMLPVIVVSLYEIHRR